MLGTERQCTSGPMLAASTAPPPYANADGGTPLAEDRDAAADGGYRQFMPTPQATPPPPPYQPSMQASCSMRWPLPDQGAPACAAGVMPEWTRAPSHQSQPASHQHQWMPSPYESTGVPTSARPSEAHSTAPVTAPVTAPFPAAHTIPPPPPTPPSSYGGQRVQSSSSDAGSSHASHCTSIPSAVSSAAKTTGGAPKGSSSPLV